MITIRFGSGVVAAFIFLVFELLVFPALLYTTSKTASLFLYWHASKGNDVQVSQMKFPLWNEGLSRHQRSHVLLLVVRIILVTIPVYLETRLISRDEPELVTRNIQTALIPQPADDWFDYQSQAGEDIIELRNLGLETYFACTHMEEDGWVWAKVANVTLLDGFRQEIRCVSSTQTPIYRLEEEVIDFLGDTDTENITLTVSMNEGLVKDFPSELVLHGTVEDARPNDEAFRITKVRNLNDTDLDCFFADSVKTAISRPSNGVRPIEWRGWCQRVQGQMVEFYSLGVELDEIRMSEEFSVSGAIRTRNGTFDTSVKHRGNFEFKDRILLNAQHLTNVYPGFADSARASDVARQVLYSMARNVSVAVQSGRVLHRTEIGADVLVITVAEVAVVVVFTLLMEVGSRTVWKGVQEPNTVEGLSRFWAQSEALWTAKKRKGGDKWVTLQLCKHGSDGGGRLLLEPVRARRADEEFGGSDSQRTESD